MKNLLLLFFSALSLLSVSSMASESFAQSNPNLYVSAENTLFENHFAGPMVIEVVVDDSSISSLTSSLQEPIVTVDDNRLRMVQSDDGKWYAGIFSLNPNLQSSSNVVVILQDNDYTILEDKYTSDATVDLAIESISHSAYPITFTEVSSNSHSFVNYDKNGTSNAIINPEANVGKSASFEYHESIANVVVKLGSPPIALDYSDTVAKDSSVSFTVINADTDPDGDDLIVTISDVTNLDGFAIVNDDNTITFTPDSGFTDTTSFEYTIDDVYVDQTRVSSLWI